MDLDDAFKNKLAKILTSNQIIFNAPMSEHTTFKIGGAADVLTFPSNIDEVAAVIKLTNAFKIPYAILGNGSNVLVLDKGIRGAVIKFSDNFFGKIRIDGEKIIADAGATLKAVSNFAAEKSLSGLEFAVGIPGSIGGAIYMNAGAYGGEMKNIVDKVTAISPFGEIISFDANELNLGYRQSIFQQNGCAICEVELNLVHGNFDEIKNQMAEFTQRRESKQPLEFPSAGSTFKRPAGYFAGTLIDQTGLKGLKVGGAMVSEKHAGFVVNAGNATAEDVLNLINEVRRRVMEVKGVMLTPEVRILGE